MIVWIGYRHQVTIEKNSMSGFRAITISGSKATFQDIIDYERSRPGGPGHSCRIRGFRKDKYKACALVSLAPEDEIQSAESILLFRLPLEL